MVQLQMVKQFCTYRSIRNSYIYIYADKSIEDGRNKEFVFQSLVVPDLRHNGIKTSLSYPADDEALSYNIKSGLRDAISQAYRR